jgi:hypothetical protein
MEKNSRINFAWQKSWCYTVKQEDTKHLDSRDSNGQQPVWVLPVLFEQGESRLLILMVQLNIDYFPRLAGVLNETENLARRKVWIERARLNRWGFSEFGKPRVENAMLETEEGPEPKYCDIVWHDVLFKPGENQSKNMVFDGFKISFDRKIDQNARLQGSMLLRIPSLVSDIEDVDYYSALGHLATRDGREVQRDLVTEIYLDFEIGLAKTVLSSLAASPCITIEAPGAPNPRRLQNILNGFHSSSPNREILIYRVVESQPQLGDENPEVGKWHWQLFGKRYHELIPIDFHILIYGYGDHEKNGRTHIEASVIANDDEDTKWLVEETKTIIQDILQRALNADV